MEEKRMNRVSAHYQSSSAYTMLYDQLWRLLQQQEGLVLRPIVVLAIGSDHYTGDSLGPLVGSYLKERRLQAVYGTLEKPVHAGNLVQTEHMIQQQYVHPIVIAIDACLGTLTEIGQIEIWRGPLVAGAAVGQRLPGVGDIAVIGVVNTSGIMGYFELQTTPLSLVMAMSQLIGQVVYDVITAVEAKALSPAAASPI